MISTCPSPRSQGEQFITVLFMRPLIIGEDYCYPRPHSVFLTKQTQFVQPFFYRSHYLKLFSSLLLSSGLSLLFINVWKQYSRWGLTDTKKSRIITSLVLLTLLLMHLRIRFDFFAAASYCWPMFLLVIHFWLAIMPDPLLSSFYVVIYFPFCIYALISLFCV